MTQEFRKDDGRCDFVIRRKSCKLVEQAARPWSIVPAKDLRLTGDETAKSTQEIGAAFAADQWIGFGDLKASSEGRVGKTREAFGVGLQRRCWIGRKSACSKHVKACKRQSLRAANCLSAAWIAVSPLRACTRIEKHADDSQIECRPHARRAVAPFRCLIEQNPAILAVKDEVAPARMEWDGE